MIKKYFSYLFISAILASFFYPFITQKLILCANTGNCNEKPILKIENNALGIFNNQRFQAPNIYLAENKQNILGKKTSFEKKTIYVNLTTQTLLAYEGRKLFMQTPISSGLWGKTPTGEFSIWSMFRSTRMSGGQGADYYNLPNVPYVMFFSNNEVAGSRGFSLHGTYWHNNFGHPMSHGCVNMKTSDVAKLYGWVANDTKIIIFGEAPI